MGQSYSKNIRETWGIKGGRNSFLGSENLRKGSRAGKKVWKAQEGSSQTEQPRPLLFQHVRKHPLNEKGLGVLLQAKATKTRTPTASEKSERVEGREIKHPRAFSGCLTVQKREGTTDPLLSERRAPKYEGMIVRGTRHPRSYEWAHLGVLSLPLNLRAGLFLRPRTTALRVIAIVYQAPNP